MGWGGCDHMVSVLTFNNAACDSIRTLSPSAIRKNNYKLSRSWILVYKLSLILFLSHEDDRWVCIVGYIDTLLREIICDIESAASIIK